MIKDESEIGLLARACAITAEAFAAVLGAIEPGRTERGLAVLLERAMVDLGAEGLAFDTIVASGPNGAIPHHSPGSRAFEARRSDHHRLRSQIRRLSRGHDQDRGAGRASRLAAGAL